MIKILAKSFVGIFEHSVDRAINTSVKALYYEQIVAIKSMATCHSMINVVLL